MWFLQFFTHPVVKAATIALSGIAVLVKAVTPEHTVAHRVSDWILASAVPLAAGSNGVQPAKQP